ncbi:MAG TPA: hypothetical protein VF576_12920, partial [Rubricoccaceae bacterium]
MYVPRLAVLGIALLTSAAQAQEPARPPPTYEFVGGRWFDGQAFRADTFYTVHGYLVRGRPAHVDSVVDLRGG